MTDPTTNAATNTDVDADIGYGAALAELETILDEIEDDAVDVDVLAARVKRAAVLLRVCRDRIGAARAGGRAGRRRPRPGRRQRGRRMTAGRDLAARFVEALEQRDWEALAELLDPDVVYEIPQSRERIRGRERYVRFNQEFPGDWHIAPRVVLGDEQNGSVLFDWIVDGNDPEPAIVYFEIKGGRITSVTDFWPEPYDPPPGPRAPRRALVTDRLSPASSFSVSTRHTGDMHTVPVPPSLLAVAAQVEARLDAFLADETRRWAALSADLREPYAALRSLVMAGGKRLRPAFCYWGYVGAGGKQHDSAVIDAGAAFEMLQAFALVHDDVMDGSARRRGARTAHLAFGDRHDDAGWRGEGRRFGEGVAILIGDLAHVYADKLMPADDPVVRAVWDELRLELNAGQLLDVLGTARRH